MASGLTPLRNDVQPFAPKLKRTLGSPSACPTWPREAIISFEAGLEPALQIRETFTKSDH